MTATRTISEEQADQLAIESEYADLIEGAERGHGCWHYWLEGGGALRVGDDGTLQLVASDEVEEGGRDAAR